MTVGKDGLTKYAEYGALNNVVNKRKTRLKDHINRNQLCHTQKGPKQHVASAAWGGSIMQAKKRKKFSNSSSHKMRMVSPFQAWLNVQLPVVTYIFIPCVLFSTPNFLKTTSTVAAIPIKSLSAIRCTANNSHWSCWTSFKEMVKTMYIHMLFQLVFAACTISKGGRSMAACLARTRRLRFSLIRWGFRIKMVD